MTDATPRCIETRTRHGMKYRRYEHQGKRWTTVEMPVSVMKAVGVKRVNEAHATWQRGQAKREASEKLRNAIIERLPGKPTAIAHELGCSEAYVRHVRQQAKIPIARPPGSAHQ